MAGSVKCGNFLTIAENLFASQEGLFSMEYVTLFGLRTGTSFEHSSFSQYSRRSPA